MLVMSYTGARPGSLIESQYHRGSNNGLLYKDVEVTLLKMDGSLKIVLGVKLRHRKHRRNSGEAYVETLCHYTILLI